jgi:hypothetical protein
MINLLALISRDTQLRKTSAHNGGEYSGPCPICRCGQRRPVRHDRFKVWPNAAGGQDSMPGRWACLGRRAGRRGCDRGGDAIQYLRDRDNLTFQEACDRLGIRRRQR